MKLTPNSVISHDGSSFLSDNVLSCGLSSVAPSLSNNLTVGFDVSILAPPLLSHLETSNSEYYSFHGTRRRTSPHIENFSAGLLKVSSAWLVLVDSPNLRSKTAASNAINIMTEQRRCEAA